ncbi:MAG: hypothetical protein WDA16_07330 [Candidatus Thermoplasmatota archaeon]
MTTATVPVHVHLGDNLPYKRHDQELLVDLDIELTGDSSWIGFRKRELNGGTTYEMFVHDLGRLGIAPAAPETDVERALSDVVIALNLASARAVFTLEGRTFATFPLSAGEAREPPIIETDSEGNVTIRATETIRLRDFVSARLSTRVPINADQVLSAYQRLEKLRRDPVTHHNLSKAVDRFTDGCNSLDHETTVARYAETFSLAITLEGAELAGDDLDREVAARTSIPVEIIRDVRTFYNRSKHLDRKPEEQRAYQDGLKRIASLSYQARRIAVASLLSGLPSEA